MIEFIRTLGSTDLLSPDEEMELAKRVEMGDLGARDSLVEHNLRLVISIAKRYMGCGLSFEDLVQEGTAGLLKAAERFDWRRGIKFSSVAQMWINQAINAALTQQTRTIRTPPNVYQLQTKYRRLLDEYARRGEATPDIKELAKILGVGDKYLSSVIKNMENTLSLETTVGDETTFAEFVVDEDARTFEDAVETILSEEVKKMLSELDERSRYIITRRFGLDQNPPDSLGDIGRKLGITRERVRQVEAETLKKLQNNPKIAHLRDYL